MKKTTRDSEPLDPPVPGVKYKPGGDPNAPSKSVVSEPRIVVVLVSDMHAPLGTIEWVQRTDEILEARCAAKSSIKSPFGKSPLRYTELWKCLDEIAAKAKGGAYSVQIDYRQFEQAGADDALLRSVIEQTLGTEDVFTIVHTKHRDF